MPNQAFFRKPLGMTKFFHKTQIGYRDLIERSCRIHTDEEGGMGKRFRRMRFPGVFLLYICDKRRRAWGKFVLNFYAELGFNIST